jgi:hypothetical protein
MAYMELVTFAVSRKEVAGMPRGCSLKKISEMVRLSAFPSDQNAIDIEVDVHVWL